jgi:hypothetical protein
MRKLCVGGLAAAVLALGAGATTAAAAPVVRQAAGAAVGDIQPTVDQFRNDLGALNAGAPAASGRRQIAWDGVPDLRAAPSFMPENQFRGAGALFATPGLGFEVSGDGDDPTNTDPDRIEFDDLDPDPTTAPNYSDDFAPFSPPRLFTAVGSAITDVTFVVPGSATRAQSNGFGVVFSDVDLAGSTKLDLFDASGQSLGSFAVPPAGNGSQTFSFLGVFFDAGERIALARITSGGAALGVVDVTNGGPADLVVMDDFIFGEPQAVPPPPPPPGPDTQAPDVQLRGAARSVRLRSFVRRGLRLTLTPNEATSFRVALLASVRAVRIARNELTLSSRRLGEAEGARTLRIRPKRRLLRNAPRRFGVRLVVEATDAAGNTRTLGRTIRVRR